MNDAATPQAQENTDRLLYEDESQDVGYRDNCSVTADGAILLCAGGYCSGKKISEWVELAWPKNERGMPATQPQAQTLEKVRELAESEQLATGNWLVEEDRDIRNTRIHTYHIDADDGSDEEVTSPIGFAFENDLRFICKLRNAFPEIAALVESQAKDNEVQAKRITELEGGHHAIRTWYMDACTRGAVTGEDACNMSNISRKLLP